MKKLLTLLLCICMCFGFTACGSGDNGDATNTDAQISQVRFDCFEFDTKEQTFTDNILLSINLQSNYIETPKEELQFSDPIYYIGEYKRYDEEGNTNRVISIYQTTSPDIDFSYGFSKLDSTWYVKNDEYQNQESYQRWFYSDIQGNKVVIKMTNTDMKPLSNEDSLTILSFMLDTEFSAPEIEEETSVIVDGTIDNPAKIGRNEWVSTYVLNPANNKYEPVCVCIDSIYSGSVANRVAEDLQNTLIANGKESNPLFEESDELRFVYMEYSVYFPSSFTEGTNGIQNVVIPFTLVNLADDGQGITGYTNLNSFYVDISTPQNNLHSGSIWTDGKALYRMPLRTTAAYEEEEDEEGEVTANVIESYFIKLLPKTTFDPKYFKIN